MKHIHYHSIALEECANIVQVHCIYCNDRVCMSEEVNSTTVTSVPPQQSVPLDSKSRTRQSRSRSRSRDRGRRRRRRSTSSSSYSSYSDSSYSRSSSYSSSSSRSRSRSRDQRRYKRRSRSSSRRRRRRRSFSPRRRSRSTSWSRGRRRRNSPPPRRDSRFDQKNREQRIVQEEKKKEPVVRKRIDHLDANTRSGGVYIPPFKMKQMLEAAAKESSSSEKFQKLQWDALKKSINGLINKVNTANIRNIVEELFHENLVRGRGLFARAIMKSQMVSASFTHVYAALLAVINSKLPEIGELVIKRTVRQFLRSFKRNDKLLCLASTTFLAHLVNQQVAHEIVALELIYLLLEKPTDDSVEIAVGFVKSCGAIMLDLIPKGMSMVFERFRAILQEGDIDTRVQYMIEGLFVVRRNNFSEYPAIIPDLDLVEAEDQIPHEISLNDEHDPEASLDVFSFDPEWDEHESQYKEIRHEIIGESDEENEPAGGSLEEEQVEPEDQQQTAVTGLEEEEKQAADVAYRRQVYLTIMSSANFEECAHKLMKMLQEGRERVMAEMLVECCAQEKTFQKFYGMIGERFCNLNRRWMEVFDELFADQYTTIHRFDTNKIRNIAKFYAHLLYTDALQWSLMEYIVLTEEETTSSSRIFLKVLFQELSEYMTLQKLRDRLYDPEYAEYFTGIFPKDTAKHCRFSINFFTSIGLGPITDEMREYLQQLQSQQPSAESISSDEYASDSDASE